MSKQKLDIHPTAKIMPPMSDAEYRALKDDIEANGLKNSVALFDGKVIDGIHRMQACIDLGMTLKTFDVKLNGQTPAEFVLSQNLHRRHLTTSQRSIVAANLATLLDGERKNIKKPEANGAGAPNGAPGISQADAAEMLNVSRRNVQRAAVVVEEGSKALQEAVAAGEVPVNAAADITELPKAEQTAAVKAGKEGIQKAVAKVRKKKEKAKGRGEAKQDVRLFNDLESLIGKAVRANTAIKEQFGDKGQHEYIRVRLSQILDKLKEWRKA